AGEFPDIAHYSLVELPQRPSDIVKRDKFLSDHSIRPIWYPSGSHEWVEIILSQLIEFARSKKQDPSERSDSVADDDSVIHANSWPRVSTSAHSGTVAASSTRLYAMNP